LVYAEQFVDIDVTKEQVPEELLRQARMILSTDLGKDPLLRQEIRQIFKAQARISVLPTEKGITKIDEHHPYYVSFRIIWSESTQLVHILSSTSNTCTTSR